MADEFTEITAEESYPFLVFLVVKKLANGKSMEVIADEIEAGMETIISIVKELKK